MYHKMHRTRLYMQAAEAKLERVSPMMRMQNQKIYVDSLQDRMQTVFDRKYQQTFQQYEKYARNLPDVFKVKYNTCAHMYELLLAKLHGLSPTAKLTGGYGYIENQSGQPVAGIGNVKKGESVQITVHDGCIHTVVQEITEKSEE